MTDSSEMEGQSSNSEGRLETLLQKMFPNHGPIDIIVRREKNEKGEKYIVCKLSIAGEDIKCQGNFENEQTAKDTLSASTTAFLEAFANRKAEILPVFEGTYFEEGMRQILDSAASFGNLQCIELPFVPLSEEISKSDQFTPSSSSSIIKPLEVQDDGNASVAAKTSCISILTKYMQKLHPNKKYEPEFVTANHRFGCQYKYLGREYVVAAVYSNKQEAREALARQICEAVIPSMFPQESTSAGASVADISLNTSGDYVSWVNIFCQKGNLNLPAYENIQEGTMWRVQVVFNDQTFISSAAYPKVASAKINVAKQLYDYITERASRNEILGKGGVLERPKLPVPGSKLVHASLPIAPMGVQPIPFIRPSVSGFQFPVGYPHPGFYGIPSPITQESVSTAAAQIPSSPVSNLMHNPMANMQQIPGIPGIPSQVPPPTQFYPAQNNSAPDISQIPQGNNPIHYQQQQQMASLYYQQYLAHQMRLLHLQQQMMYQQQYQAYPHLAVDGASFVNNLPRSYPLSISPLQHQVSQDQNCDPYSLPPFPYIQKPQSPPRS